MTRESTVAPNAMEAEIGGLAILRLRASAMQRVLQESLLHLRVG